MLSTTINYNNSNSNSNSNNNSNVICSDSAISTIFIIGFPDDFKERELVNMFLFAPGFEGAVIKTTTISQCPEEAPQSQSQSQAQARKQLIGFGKFSKPSEALYAVEILNGRILDQERGLILKAEIAKKNLFIKKGGSTNISTSISSSSSSNSITSITCADSHNPSDQLDDQNEENYLIQSFTSLNRSTSSPSSSFSCVDCIFSSICASSSSSSNTRSRVMSITLPGQADPALICAPESELKASTEKNEKTDPLDSLPLEQLGVPEVHLSSSSLIVSSSSPNNIKQFIPVITSSSSSPSPSSLKMTASTMPVDLASLQKGLITSPALGSMAAIVGENFPCNTLYVGNLPSSTQEEELRALFRNCLGYRRLSFRPKSNGPMCFVEFDNIACATAAMETLYGTMISSSTQTKGGIRLSYSKNPLGLRVASPAPVSSVVSSPNSPPSSSNTYFMEAIGAETDNPEQQQAISTILTHYFKHNNNNNNNNTLKAPP